MTTVELSNGSHKRIEYLAIGVGGVIAGLTVAVRQLGWLSGPIALALVLVVVLALPTSRALSRRILLGGLIAFGWTQVVWWRQLPFDRMTFLLALLLGLTVWWTVRKGDFAIAIRQLTPRLRGVDVLPFAVGAFGVFAFRPWLFKSDGTSALALLLPGWDNSAHFNMFHMTWSNGGTIDVLAAPSSSTDWMFLTYPQGFHAAAASLAQLMWPGAVHDVSSSLVAYNRVTAIIVIAAVVTLVAGLCSMPRLRNRWDIAAPLSAMIAAAFFVGPGATAVQEGFASFVLPCALIGASVFVYSSMGRVAQPIRLLALCGAFMGAAFGWIILLLPALPIAAAAVLPLTKRRYRASRGAWIATVLIVIATIIGVLRAARLVFAGASLSSLAAPGGISHPSLGMVAVLVLSCVGLGLVAIASSRRGTASARMTTWNVALLVTVPLVCTLVAAGLAWMQIGEHGMVQYYFWKFVLGSELILVAVLALIVAHIVPLQISRTGASGRALTGTGVLITSLAATQVYGYSGPASVETGLVSDDATTVAQGHYRAAGDNLLPAAAALLSAVTTIDGPGIGSAYLEDPPGLIHPLNAQQWYLSLRDEWTTQGNGHAAALQGNQDSLETIVPVVESWLISHPGAVVVSPSLRPALVNEPRLAQFSDRVLTWG